MEASLRQSWMVGLRSASRVGPSRTAPAARKSGGQQGQGCREMQAPLGNLTALWQWAGPRKSSKRRWSDRSLLSPMLLDPCCSLCPSLPICVVGHSNRNGSGWFAIVCLASLGKTEHIPPKSLPSPAWPLKTAESGVWFWWELCNELFAPKSHAILDRLRAFGASRAYLPESIPGRKHLGRAVLICQNLYRDGINSP